MKLKAKQMTGNASFFGKVSLHLGLLLVFISSFSTIPRALAAAPVITTSSTIANGAFNPAPIIVGVGFATDVNRFDFTVNMGNTNLVFDSVAFIDLTHIRLNFHGTTNPGTISIFANSSAFYPASGETSNELTIVIAVPLLSQAIIFNVLAPMLVGEKDQSPIAASSSFLSVAIMSNSPSICTIDFAKVHAVAAGSCSLKASQQGDDKYAPASDVTMTVKITSAPTEKKSEAKPVEVTTNLRSAVYDPASTTGVFVSVLVLGSGSEHFALVKLNIPSHATKDKTVFLISAFSSDEETAAGYFIARIAAVTSDGVSIRRFIKAIEVSIPAGNKDGYPYWSYDGNSWHRLLKLETKNLPSKLHEGYFVENDGRIAILSDYLMLVGFRKPQAPLSLISPLERLNVSATAALKSVGGSGLGQLLYKSTTESICSISAKGVVTGLSEGSCLINAFKAASGNFADTSTNQIAIKIIGVSNISKGVAAPVNTGFLTHSLTLMKVNKSQLLNVGLCSIYADERAMLYLGTKAKNGEYLWRQISEVQLDENGAGEFTVKAPLSAGQRVRILVNGVIQMEGNV